MPTSDTCLFYKQLPFILPTTPIIGPYELAWVKCSAVNSLISLVGEGIFWQNSGSEIGFCKS